MAKFILEPLGELEGRPVEVVEKIRAKVDEIVRIVNEIYLRLNELEAEVKALG